MTARCAHSAGLRRLLPLWLGLLVSLAPAAQAAEAEAKRTRLLNETELIALVTDVLQRDHVKAGGQLELRLIRAWTPLPVPEGPLTLQVIDLPATGLSAHCIIRFELLAGDARVGSWQLVLQAKLWSEVLVARSVLRRGQPLNESDFLAERRDLLAVRGCFPPAEIRTPGLELVENLNAGAPLLQRSVRLRPLIQRGKVLEALYQQGSLSIALKVEALENGLLGQNIRVRNVLTKREFYGKVQNEQTVLVSL